MKFNEQFLEMLNQFQPVQFIDTSSNVKNIVNIPLYYYNNKAITIMKTATRSY